MEGQLEGQNKNKREKGDEDARLLRFPHDEDVVEEETGDVSSDRNQIDHERVPDLEP